MRLIFRLVLVTLVGVCTSRAAAQGSTTAEAKRPNIILIVADDLGYADLGCQGLSTDVRTPNIDAIARAGVRLTNGYVSGTVCSPSRAGFLTGRYQQRFGHEFNPGGKEASNFGLPLEQITLARALKAAGYRTGMVGKWHLGYKHELHPLRRGFEEFFGFLGGGHDYFDPSLGMGVILRGDEAAEERSYLTDAFSREAVSFVEKQHAGAKPFFLYLAYNAIHSPMQAPQTYMDRFKDVPDNKRQTMLAMLSALDDGVGRLMEKLREHGLEEETLIFFISDNGGPTGDNGSRNTPLRGFKGSTWEGGIRVPFIVQWKGTLPEGRTFGAPAIALDIFTTSLAAAGVAPPPDRKIDGVNLLPHLAGDRADAPHDALYWRSGEHWAIRDGDYKLRRMNMKPPMLFDLSKDQAEQTDLAASQPAIAKRLQAKYDAWAGEMIAPLWRMSTAPPAWRNRPSSATEPALGSQEK